MTSKVRGADIKACIDCFTCLCKPCGATGRAGAVRCGVCINNCRKCCCCGPCIAGTSRCCVSLCGSMWRALLVLAVVLVSSYMIWKHWDTISETAVDAYNTTSHNPNVQNFLNTSVNLYDSAKDQVNEGIDQISNNPDVIRFGNKTAEVYEDTKQTVLETFDKIKSNDHVEQAVNGTVGFFNWAKEKIWG